jgi:hypothetical protein
MRMVIASANGASEDDSTILSIDLEKLAMWEPLQGLLVSPSDDVKTQALWVIGTAIQNNPEAQKSVRQKSGHNGLSQVVLTGQEFSSTSPSTPSPLSYPPSPHRPARRSSSDPRPYTRSPVC